VEERRSTAAEEESVEKHLQDESIVVFLSEDWVEPLRSFVEGGVVYEWSWRNFGDEVDVGRGDREQEGSSSHSQNSTQNQDLEMEESLQFYRQSWPVKMKSFDYEL
jgi:hypothetical protein